jgi:CRISPR/Cas system-associated exonuclease Cas4 (RecB family)
MTISKKYKHNEQKFVITGTVDCVFDGMIIDIKSMSTFRFKVLDKNFPQDFMNYVEQVQLYMDMLEMKKGALLFKDKNTAELKLKVLKYNDLLMQKILDKVAHIHELLKIKKLVDRPYGRDTWICKLCQYRLPCWKIPMEVRHWNVTGPPKDALAGRIRARLGEVPSRKRKLV